MRVREGKTIVLDGPFAETKEALGGYLIFESDDPDAVVELAARIPASADRGNRTDDLVGSMMSAGYDRFAAAWGGVADGLDGDDGHRAWSILAVGAPRAVVDLSAGRVEDFTESAGSHRGRMLVAALAGFEETMLFVSHDRHFLTALSDRVLKLTPEGVRQHGGGYTEYVARTGQEAPGLHPSA